MGWKELKVEGSSSSSGAGNAHGFSVLFVTIDGWIAK